MTIPNLESQNIIGATAATFTRGVLQLERAHTLRQRHEQPVRNPLFHFNEDINRFIDR